MDNNLKIFYAKNTSDKEVRRFCKEHDLDISKHPAGFDMIFLEFDHTEGEELKAVLALCASNVIVYLMQLSHLGQGAKAKEMREAIEATGAKIVVPERILARRGPKPKHNLTPEQIEKYRPDYEKKTVTRQFVLDKILRDENVKLTRHQLRSIYKK